MKVSEIESLFKNGRRVNTKTFTIIWVPSDKSDVIISAPVRIFKKATDRNYIKRIVREALIGVNLGKRNICFIWKADVVRSLDDIRSELRDVKF